MAKCNNCGAKLSCSCEKKKSKNGKSCCSRCIKRCNKETVTKNSNNDSPSLVKAEAVNIKIW